MKVTAVGMDPGVVDTALVSIEFDTREHTYLVTHQVWTGVTTRQKDGSILVSVEFIESAKRRLQTIRVVYENVHAFLEGYRPRGKNIRQDQEMTTLVQVVNRELKLKIVDNTGIKKIAKDSIMALFNFGFPTTNHRDLESAARVLIRGMLENPDLNVVLTDFVIDHLDGRPWRKT